MNLPLNNFSAGELSEKLSSGLEIYNRGCSLLENMVPLSQGGMTKRPGTRFMGHTKNNGQARLLPFVINDSLAYLLELGAGYIRFWTDGELIESTPGTPLEVVTTYSAAAVWEIQFCQIYNILLLAHGDYPPAELKWTGGHNFSFGAVAFTGNAGELPFQTTGNYPRCIAPFNGRVAWASTDNEPQGVWVSEPFEHGGMTYFDTLQYTVKQLKDPGSWADPAVAEVEDVQKTKDVVGAGHAFRLTIASDRNDRIQWMCGQKDLIIGTSSGEWIIPQSVDALSIAAVSHTRIGSAARQATVINDAIVFLQRYGTKLREYRYSDTIAAYNSPDLCWQADHVLEGGAVQMDFQSTPDPYVYLVRADGTLCVLAYNRMYGVQGWSRVLISGGAVESVAVLPGDAGNDVVHVVVNRGNSRTIEVFDPFFTPDHLDSKETKTISGGQITGLARFEGAEVCVMQNGSVLTTGVVSGGAVSAPGSGVVTVGLVYRARCRTMRLNVPSELGTSQGQKKRISNIVFQVYQSSTFRVGPSADRLETVTMDNFTGNKEAAFPGDWDTDGYVYFEQDSHADLTVLAVIPEVA